VRTYNGQCGFWTGVAAERLVSRRNRDMLWLLYLSQGAEVWVSGGQARGWCKRPEWAGIEFLQGLVLLDHCAPGGVGRCFRTLGSLFQIEFVQLLSHAG